MMAVSHLRRGFEVRAAIVPLDSWWENSTPEYQQALRYYHEALDDIGG